LILGAALPLPAQPQRSRESELALLRSEIARLTQRLAAARQAFLDELDTTTLAECAYPTPRRGS